jgi:hypothetical protein
MSVRFLGSIWEVSCPTLVETDFYVARVEKGMRPTMARLTLARKIATITLTMWKKGVGFDPQNLHRQAA